MHRKKIDSSVLSAAAIGSIGTAHAVIIETVTDSVTKNPDILVNVANSMNPLNFFHDITDSGFVYNFDTVISASISVRLTDATGGGNEKYRIALGDQIFAAGTGVNVENATRDQLTGGTFLDIVLP